MCYITRARKHDREGRYDENGEKRERKKLFKGVRKYGMVAREDVKKESIKTMSEKYNRRKTKRVGGQWAGQQNKKKAKRGTAYLQDEGGKCANEKKGITININPQNNISSVLSPTRESPKDTNGPVG